MISKTIGYNGVFPIFRHTHIKDSHKKVERFRSCSNLPLGGKHCLVIYVLCVIEKSASGVNGVLTIHHHHPPTWPLVTKPGSVVVGCCWFDQYPMIHFSCHFHSFHSYNQEFSRWSGGPPSQARLGRDVLGPRRRTRGKRWGLRVGMLRDIWSIDPNTVWEGT